ncbi:hypothetical protein ACFL06_02030 [Patescibacteria group bacterium]
MVCPDEPLITGVMRIFLPIVLCSQQDCRDEEQDPPFWLTIFNLLRGQIKLDEDNPEHMRALEDFASYWMQLGTGECVLLEPSWRERWWDLLVSVVSKLDEEEHAFQGLILEGEVTSR